MYCLNEIERNDWMTKILLVLAMKYTQQSCPIETKQQVVYKTLSLPDISDPAAEAEEDKNRPVSWMQFLSKWNRSGKESRQSSTKSNKSCKSNKFLSRTNSREEKDF